MDLSTYVESIVNFFSKNQKETPLLSPDLNKQRTAGYKNIVTFVSDGVLKNEPHLLPSDLIPYHIATSIDTSNNESGILNPLDCHGITTSINQSNNAQAYLLSQGEQPLQYQLNELRELLHEATKPTMIQVLLSSSILTEAGKLNINAREIVKHISEDKASKDETLYLISSRPEYAMPPRTKRLILSATTPLSFRKNIQNTYSKTVVPLLIFSQLLKHERFKEMANEVKKELPVEIIAQQIQKKY